MCGITGHLEWHGMAQAAILEQQTEAIRHRGPDSAGFFWVNQVALGMRRLAIIDLAHGAQPMFSRDADLALVFNGEIYNFQALRQQLQQLGQTFDSHSDTEVIVRGIEQWGIAGCVERLNGMFALAIWQQQAQRLTLVRDRLGIKPLYWYADAQRLVFGSEIKAILAHPAVPRQINLHGLANYLSFGHSLAPQTMLEGIYKVEPAHIMSWDIANQTLQQQRYWQLQPNITPIAPAAAAAEVYSRLREAVRLQLISDVPLGAFLSGGLDSSIIVGLMSRLGAAPINTFSVGFANQQGFNELPDAALVAQHFGSKHHELLLDANDLVGALQTLVYHYDEPFGDAAGLPVYLVSRFAREHVKVVLTGEGSDEQWAGYRRYQAELIARMLQYVPGHQALGALIRQLPRNRRLKQAIRSLEQRDPARRYAAWLTIADLQQRQRLLQPQLSAALGDYAPEQIYDQVYPRSGAALTNMGLADLQTWLPDTYLEKVDKASMAASIEARVPFLDHTLVEWTMNLPNSLKLRGRQTKWLLRQAFGEMLPQRTLRKPKHGFAVPTDPWFRGALSNWTAEILFDQRTLARGLFNAHEVRRIYQAHRDGKQVADTLLWLLLNLELWQRIYLDREARL
ncbi:asparagine synthase (glutamine-hydrolyzing) [Herpetosiphon giganteus]|uniref:asparagine synthase (glutamine-hydrolyzing) n=1 Tax=Herpetosiphon giganteus TaxID=2029754 RepID=UPI00195D8166|nr:asparagine synthase (glutamine-hydrolyzing) [Herpetosiphon giganteus]MBM7841716.1 asparagine synthase (glutamine-hydrolyzing) [Herpetosiphon giganteus]